MSCPHSLTAEETDGKDMGMAIGAVPELATRIIGAIKSATTLPISVKMSPNIELPGYFARVYKGPILMNYQLYEEVAKW